VNCLVCKLSSLLLDQSARGLVHDLAICKLEYPQVVHLLAQQHPHVAESINVG